METDHNIATCNNPAKRMSKIGRVEILPLYISCCNTDIPQYVCEVKQDNSLPVLYLLL